MPRDPSRLHPRALRAVLFTQQALDVTHAMRREAGARGDTEMVRSLTRDCVFFRRSINEIYEEEVDERL